VDVTDDAEQKAALKLIVARQSIARPFAAPPGIPTDRARALRDAFDATMKDPDFIAEAKGQNLDVDPVSGAEVETLIREVYASSPEAVRLATTSLKESKE
jgi:tripartite-type tricarboxylate transporter receptor subunit TctC